MLVVQYMLHRVMAVLCCFFYGNNSNVVFHKNTATFAGTAIYVDIDSCNSTFDEVFHVNNTKYN